MATTKSKSQDLSRILEAVFSQLRGIPELEEERFRIQVDGLCTSDAYGYTYVDKDAPGTLKFCGRDRSGRKLEGNASYVDSQSEGLQSVQESIEAEEQDRTASEIAEDPNSPLPARVDAIQCWLIEAPEEASKFILNALSATPIQPELRDALVFLSEDARYSNASDRNALAAILKDVATEIIESRTPDSEHVVWSAIRRFASLIPHDRIDDLRVFLRNSGGLDTRLVALQGILYAFESQPVAPTLLPELRDRVFQMAIKLIDADILTPGDNSAVLELAICSLFAMGDPRAEDCVGQVQRLGWDWLTNQVLTGLRELRDGWDEHSEDRVVKEAIHRITTVCDTKSNYTTQPLVEFCRH